MKTCKNCGGMGFAMGVLSGLQRYVKCAECKGRGKVSTWQRKRSPRRNRRLTEKEIIDNFVL